MAPYERLRAWQLCHQLALEVYEVTKGFPSHEKYGLTSQARRAAFSAAANIVEGSSRRGRREFKRFLDISLSSLTELGYALRYARDLGFLEASAWKKVDQVRAHASIVTWKLYDSLRRRKDSRDP